MKSETLDPNEVLEHEKITQKLVIEMGNINEFIEADVKDVLETSAEFSKKSTWLLIAILTGGLFIGLVSAFVIVHKIRALFTLVKEKTDQVSTILENVHSGFLLIGEDMKIRPGFTESCHKIIGDNIAPGLKLTEALGLGIEEMDHAECFREQVFSDVMPDEISMAQAPSQFKIGDKVLGFLGML